MTKKFCTACQQDRPIEGGTYKKTKVVRWVCARCFEKNNLSRYASKGKSNERGAKHDQKIV